jgi:hypothetical protein
MPEPTKRPHYFDHQFLRDEDFTLEQAYHLTRRRLHNRVLHTWGIARGLELTFAAGASVATVSAGEAIDSEGREIVLPANTQTQDVSNLPGKTVYVTIAYGEAETDPRSDTGVTGNTRYTETPVIEVGENAPARPGERLILGRLTVGADGKITGTDDGVDPNRRRLAGAVAGDLEARSLALTAPGVVTSQWPRLRLGAPSRADLAGSLSVSGSLGVGATTPQTTLDVRGNLTIESAQIFTGTGTTDVRKYVALLNSPRSGNASGLKAGGVLVSDMYDYADPSRNDLIVKGNVGIGTPAPGGRFTVKMAGGGWNDGLVIEKSDSANRWQFSFDVGDRLLLGYNGGMRVSFIGGTGNVGIGMADPRRRFQVGSDVNGIGFDASDASPNAGYIRFGDNTGWKLHFGRSRESAGGAINTGTTGLLLTIQDNGNVGIGTATPQSRLQVRSLTTLDEGASAAGAWANIGSNAYLDGAWKRIDATRAGVNFHMNADGGGQEFRFLRTEANGVSRNLAVLGSGTSFILEGNVGIGTTGPAAKLTVDDPTGNTTWNTAAFRKLALGPHWSHIHHGPTGDWYIRSAAGGGKVVLQDTGGSVGIGTAAPPSDTKLQVEGGPITMRVARGWGDWIQLVKTDVTPNTAWIIHTPQAPNSEIHFGFWNGSAINWGTHVFRTNGDLHIKGALSANGGKGGYVMDQFLNNLGAPLEQGDVVVVGDSQPSLSYGQDDNIPIPEVDVAQQAYDTRVCGIVCQAYARLKPAGAEDDESGASSRGRRRGRAASERGRVGAAQPEPFTSEELVDLDRTKVESGQIGWMVTLGAFAHVKVDADIAEIKTGDLLTTSPTKGHAQKVLDRSDATGAIIGKALGSLQKGKGKIPVLVMLQ